MIDIRSVNMISWLKQKNFERFPVSSNTFSSLNGGQNILALTLFKFLSKERGISFFLNKGISHTVLYSTEIR